MRDLDLQLNGYRITTAEIVYYMPDHPALLQSFIWQFNDLAPKYPKLHKFLDYWRQNIEATIHSVAVMNREQIGPSKTRAVRHELVLH
ncbi:MAG: aspartate-semialdehyde dehydrogenase [Rickettsiales bacterium]|jgi:uncharacterized protein Usg